MNVRPSIEIANQIKRIQNTLTALDRELSTLATISRQRDIKEQQHTLNESWCKLNQEYYSHYGNW